MRIKDVMRTQAIAVAPDETLEHAQALMRLHNVAQLVVVSDRTVKGVVTTHQIAEARPDCAVVEDVMSKRVLLATPNLAVRKAANLLRGSAVAALPVVDRGHLVGIVTVADLLELVGRGSERPVARGKRWTLRHRGLQLVRGPAIRR
jgi:CBS domain-containing protein